MDGMLCLQRSTKMKSFKQLIVENKEDSKPVVMAFGRMNPPTTGHMKLIDKVRDIADRENAPHAVIVSHSQDSKKNPLSAQQKLKHLRRYSPGTHFIGSSSAQPTLLHHAAELHKMGHRHLIMVAGSDRVKEYHDLLNKYNGVEGRHGKYNFNKIEVRSAGHRDPDAEGSEGMSGTKMRQHAQHKDFSSFRQGVPSHVSDEHAKELMHDVRKGMGLHESANHGYHKAIFVTGGPGSGKDVVIRECIAEQNVMEFNFTQVMDVLNDKHKLAMRSMNPRTESIRTGKPLIINGPADDSEKIAHIKEELEELGYKTMMVFVDTTDVVSKERNTLLSRMMAESIRHDRWNKAQNNINLFTNLFTNFVRFDNTGDLENNIDNITETYQITTQFLDNSIKENNRFLSLYESKQGAKAIQKANLASKGFKVLKDNNSPIMQFQAKLGKRDDVRDGDIKMNGGYSKIGGQAFSYAEDSEPKLIKMPEPKEANFNKDADKIRLKKFGDRSLKAGRIGNTDGVGSTFDTRGSTPAAGAGLGDQGTYRESTEYSNDDVADFSAKPRGVSPNPLAEKKKLKKFKESIFDFGQGDSGVSGTLGGAGNKEDFVKPSEKFGQSGITIKKKKTGVK